MALAQGLIPANAITALYWAINDEVDLRPLLERLAREGRPVVLPCTPDHPAPLTFRRWTPETGMKSGSMGTVEPISGAPALQPNVLFLPLLAFDSSGRRLGYGGGFYDRTLGLLRSSGAIKALWCRIRRPAGSPRANRCARPTARWRYYRTRHHNLSSPIGFSMRIAFLGDIVGRSGREAVIGRRSWFARIA